MFYKRRLDELNKIIDNFNSHHNKTGYEYLAVFDVPKKNYLPKRYLGDYAFEYHANYLLMINGTIINNGEEIKIEFDYTFGGFNSSKSAVICGNVILDETDTDYEITISQKGVNIKKGIPFKSIKRIETTRNNKIVYDSSTYSDLNINMEKYYYIIVYKDKILYDIIYPGDFVFLGLCKWRLSYNIMESNIIMQFPRQRLSTYTSSTDINIIRYSDIYGTSMDINSILDVGSMVYKNRGGPYNCLLYASDDIDHMYIKQLKVLRRGAFWNDILEVALGQAYSVNRQQYSTDYDIGIAVDKHYLYKDGAWSEMIETDDSIKPDSDKPEDKHQYTYDDPIIQKEACELSEELRNSVMLENIIPESVRRSSKHNNYFKF